MQNLYVCYGHVVVFTSKTSGTIKSLRSDRAVPFTLNKGILSDPPATNISRALRHFIERTASRVSFNYKY